MKSITKINQTHILAVQWFSQINQICMSFKIKTMILDNITASTLYLHKLIQRNFEEHLIFKTGDVFWLNYNAKDKAELKDTFLNEEFL